MPESIKTLEILIKLRDQATRGIKDLNKNIRFIPNLASAAKNALSRIGSEINNVRSKFDSLIYTALSLKGAIVSLGVGFVARSFIHAASTAEGYRTRLVALLGSVKEGNRLFNAMADYAGTVSFQYEEIMGAATQLAGIMKGGVEEIKRWIPLIGDLAAAAGLDIQTTTQQFIRMYSSGAASADLFRERGITAMLGFKQGVSYLAEETRKQLLKAWQDPASKFRNLSFELAKTWDGLWSMMSDMWFAFRNMVMDAGVFDFLKAGVAAVLAEFQRLKEKGDLQAFAKRMADTVIKSLEEIIYWSAAVSESFRGWKIIWNSFVLLYAKTAPYLINSFGLLAEAIGGVGVVFASIMYAIGKEDVAKNIMEAVEGVDDLIKFSQGQKDFWKQLVEDTEKHLLQLSKEKDSFEKIEGVLNNIRKRIREYQADRDKPGRPKPKAVEEVPEPKAEEKLKSELSRYNTLIEGELKKLQVFYDQGLKSTKAYFEERKVLLDQQYEEQKRVYEKQAALAVESKKPEKILAANDKIYQLEKKHAQDLFDLTNQWLKAVKESRSEALSQQESMLQSFTSTVESFKKVEDEWMQFRTTRLVQQYQEYLKYTQNEQLANKWLQEQKKQLLDEYLKNSSIVYKALEDLSQRTAEAIEQSFSDFYFNIIENKYNSLKDVANSALTSVRRITADFFGQITKEWLVVSAKGIFDFGKKASEASRQIASITQEKIARASLTTTIALQTSQVYALATAYKALALAKAGAGFGLSAAPAHVGAGGTTAFGMSEGGSVPGTSPHSRADNVLIAATAKEFMQPVDAVKYYGRQVMEALRVKAIPRELFSGIRTHTIPRPPTSRFAYAAGGSISGGGGVKINIDNKSPIALSSDNAKVSYSQNEMIIDIVIDAADRNVKGLRDRLARLQSQK